MRPALAAFATCPPVLRVIGDIGPCEAFEGGTYVAQSGRYAGTWLDLDAVAGVTSRYVSVLLQALHLLLVVDEVPDSCPVRLHTSVEPGRGRWRTKWPKASAELPVLLRALPTSRTHSMTRDEAEMRETLLRTLRSRAAASEQSRARLTALAGRLAGMGSTPPPDPPQGARVAIVSAPALLAKPVTLRQDPAQIFEEVRRRSLELTGNFDIRTVATFLSSKANQPGAASELTILAARAWLAAGEQAHARHFAKKVVEDPSTPDDTRLTGIEILDATSPTNESMRPPPETTIAPIPIVVLSGGPELEPPEPVSSRAAPSEPDIPLPGPLPRDPVQTPSQPPPGLPIPEVSIVRNQPVSAAPVARYVRPEVVETMRLPSSAEEDMLPPGTLPSNTLQVRIAMTRLARDVGRDYRLWYGTALKTDVLAIDAMQRHLRRRFPSEVVDESASRQLERELLRHGALLSEILARRLGGEWVDVSGAHPGHWAMAVYPDARVWPIGRVYRFFRHGHMESDLVAFYLDLESYAKRK
jgi:hypothetical protein